VEFVPERAQRVALVQSAGETQRFFIDHVVTKSKFVCGFKEYARVGLNFE
jgi:hypothetical protein